MDWRDASFWCGNVAAILTIFISIPQIILNQRKRSTVGFSHATVYIRFVGLSFLLASAILLPMQLPSIAFCGANLLVNYVFLWQFAAIDGATWTYALWMLPVVTFFFGVFVPETIIVTQWFNTTTQVIGFFPYMYELYKCGTTTGISMLFHHMNFTASLFGIVSCGLSVSPKLVEWALHGLPLFWSLVVFTVAVKYGEMRYLDADIGRARRREENEPLVVRDKY